MDKSHSYKVGVAWRGNRGQGTASYAGYERAHEISSDGKPIIQGSSDRAFRGDSSRYNPEDLLLAALAACHMLSYLHVCADSGVVVTEYVDEAEGVMVTTKDGGGHFTEVTLKPTVTIAEGSDPELAKKLHEKAHHLCFIASSVNFPVRAKPTIVVGEAASGPSASSGAAGRGSD